jgi:alkylhydroperoxidase family enzyme
MTTSDLDQHLAALRRDAAAAAPGRTAALITARTRQMVHGGAMVDESGSAFGELSEAERAVVAVAEQFVLDAHGIDDDLFAQLGRHYTAAEQVGLLFHLALADGFTKLDRLEGPRGEGGGGGA